MRARVTITKNEIIVEAWAYGKKVIEHHEDLRKYPRLKKFIEWLMEKEDVDSITIYSLRRFKQHLTRIARILRILQMHPSISIFGYKVGRRQIEKLMDEIDFAFLTTDALTLRDRLSLKHLAIQSKVVCFAEVVADDTVRESSADYMYQLIIYGKKHYINYETFDRDGRFIALRTKNSIIVVDQEDSTITFIGFHDWCSEETLYRAIEWLQKKIGEMSEYLVENIVRWIAEKSRSEEAEALLGLLYAASQ